MTTHWVMLPVGDRYALVDEDDLEVVASWNWRLQPRRSDSHTYYATGFRNRSGDRTDCLMHKLITGFSETDHVNGVGLDNRRINLRESTHFENMANQRLSIANTSGYKGVVLYRRTNRWMARVKVNRKGIHLGYFDNPEDAARAYDTAAVTYFGKFAKTNAMLGLLD